MDVRTRDEGVDNLSQADEVQYETELSFLRF
jgi:hypothetical protein